MPASRTRDIGQGQRSWERAMRSPDPVTTLDYADTPSGSRLMVVRRDDTLTIIAPPSGLLHELRDLGLGQAIIFGMMAATGLLAWRRSSPAPPLGSVIRTITSLFTHVAFDLELLVALAILMAAAAAAGRVSRTIQLAAHELILESHLELWRRCYFLRRRVIIRSEVAKVAPPGLAQPSP